MNKLDKLIDKLIVIGGDKYSVDTIKQVAEQMMDAVDYCDCPDRQDQYKRGLIYICGV